jgi:hypothetical protein
MPTCILNIATLFCILLIFSTADLMVEKIRVNVPVPFMLVLWEFFKGAIDTGTIIDTPDMPAPIPLPPSTTTAAKPVATDNASAAGAGGGAAGTSFNVYGSLKQIEVVLFADPMKADSKVFVLYVSGIFFSFCPLSEWNFL